MITLPITVIEAQTLLLVGIRLGIILFMLPFFDGNYIPNTVKFPLVAILSLVFVYYVKIPTQTMPNFSVFFLILLIFKEVLYALTISICTKIIFTAVRIGLEFANIQIGFSMSTIIDPSSGVSAGAITNFFYLMALLSFILFNGPIVLLRSLAESFSILPIGEFTLHSNLAEDVVHYSGRMFYLGFKIAAPVVSAIIVITLAMALIGKAVPTMNLMLFAFPIKIAVGFVFLLLIIELIVIELETFTRVLPELLVSITKMALP